VTSDDVDIADIIRSSSHVFYLGLIPELLILANQVDLTWGE
jgi:hypothetical protein